MEGDCGGVERAAPPPAGGGGVENDSVGEGEQHGAEVEPQVVSRVHDEPWTSRGLWRRSGGGGGGGARGVPVEVREVGPSCRSDFRGYGGGWTAHSLAGGASGGAETRRGGEREMGKHGRGSHGFGV